MSQFPHLLGRVLALFIFISFLPVAIAADEVIVVVAHPSVNQQQISLSHAKQIFGMKLKQWAGGDAVKVFVLPDRHQAHASFVKQVLQIFPSQLRTAWDRQVFSGTGQAPQEVKSEDEMLAKVSSTPGAVGYLPRNKVDAQKLRMIEVR